MRLVVDSNILFTYFWKDSAFSRILGKKDLALFAPEHALVEIKEHLADILEKAKISRKEFEILREDLALRIVFIPLEEYTSFLKDAISLSIHLPEEEKKVLFEDMDFLALALKLRCPIWSNDKLMKKQTGASVLSTEEILILV